MMGNISKAAEPNVFICGTDLPVSKGHNTLESRRGVPAPALDEWAPNQNLAVQIYATVRLATRRLRRLPGLVQL